MNYGQVTVTLAIRYLSRILHCSNPQPAAYADLPGGHSEGYDDTFKQVFRRFYASIGAPAATLDYPQFVDGLRQLTILNAELQSNRTRSWVDVPAAETK